MPTVIVIGRFRFHFYSADFNEPAHIHISAPDGEAKFWLQPMGLAYSHGFRAKDLRTLDRLVREHQETLLEAWYEYFPK